MAEQPNVKGRRVPYSQIADSLIDRTDMTTSEKMCLISLIRHIGTGNGNGVFPAYQTIADHMGASRATAIRTIDRLVERGFIEKKTRSTESGMSSNWYVLSDEIIVGKQRSGVSNCNPGGYHSATPVVSPCNPKEDTSKENTKEGTRSRGPRKSHGPACVQCKAILTSAEITDEYDGLCFECYRELCRSERQKEPAK